MILTQSTFRKSTFRKSGFPKSGKSGKSEWNAY